MSYSTPGWSARREVRMPWSQIAPWARIRTAPGWRRARSTRPSASGGRPRPAWIRIGTVASSASAKMPVHLLAVEHEVLGAGVQLDAARAGRQAAFALGERVFGGVQPAEGDQPPVAFARPREHAVVGHAVGGHRARGRAAGTRTPCARPRRRAARAAARSVSERPSSSSPRCVWASITSASAGRSASHLLRGTGAQRARS